MTFARLTTGKWNFGEKNLGNSRSLGEERGTLDMDIQEAMKKCAEKMRSKRRCRPTTRRRYLEKHRASSNT